MADGNTAMYVVSRYPTEINAETNMEDIYHYPSFGVGCTEVEIDCLTGDHTVSACVFCLLKT